MDSQSYFNITREATFENIIFRGDYGLLDFDNKGETYYTSKTSVKYCEFLESEDEYDEEMLTYSSTNSVFYDWTQADDGDDTNYCYFPSW